MKYNNCRNTLYLCKSDARQHLIELISPFFPCWETLAVSLLIHLSGHQGIVWGVGDALANSTVLMTSHKGRQSSQNAVFFTKRPKSSISKLDVPCNDN